MELPPRTRRIPWGLDVAVSQYGTTSAHAENTNAMTRGINSMRNYLRARGEYFIPAGTAPTPQELPPRTRRIPGCPQTNHPNVGTTSAHAENTWKAHGIPHPSGNYLRARGEYTTIVAPQKTSMELPPRARRIQHHENIGGVNLGTTSACAENTEKTPMGQDDSGNYLRVRGEYCEKFLAGNDPLELPPRARRILVSVP